MARPMGAFRKIMQTAKKVVRKISKKFKGKKPRTMKKGKKGKSMRKGKKGKGKKSKKSRK